MKKIIVEICTGTHCTLMGAMDIMDAVASLSEIQHEADPSYQIEIRPVSCPDTCQCGRFSPMVRINDQILFKTDSETVMALILEIGRASCRVRV